MIEDIEQISKDIEQICLDIKMSFYTWTKEDIAIWRARKMPAHTIRFRYQQHNKEARIMYLLSTIKIKPSKAKLVALEFCK